MKFRLTLQRVDEGAIPTSMLANATTEAQVAQFIAGKDRIEDCGVITEVQLRGVAQYFRAIALGTNTSSVETAVSAII